MYRARNENQSCNVITQPHTYVFQSSELSSPCVPSHSKSGARLSVNGAAREVAEALACSKRVVFPLASRSRIRLHIFDGSADVNAALRLRITCRTAVGVG
jgi:hypothetical protein